MSESRKDVLLQALEAEVGGARVDPGTLFTEDVIGWSPIATIAGLTALGDPAWPEGPLPSAPSFLSGAGKAPV